MDESLVNNSEGIMGSRQPAVTFGEAVRREYPFLKACLALGSTVRSLVRAELRNPQATIGEQERGKLQDVKDLLAYALPSTGSVPRAATLGFDITTEIRDILGLEPREIEPWALQATQVIGTLQDDGWRTLSPEDRQFAEVELLEFGTRIMEQTLGPMQRLS